MTIETTTHDRAARLLAASLAAPRFAGRAALFRLAERGSDAALAALEMAPAARARALVRGELPGVVVDALGGVPAAVQAKRGARFRLLTEGRDELAEREPGNVLERALRRRFRAMLREAGFRAAAHSHRQSIVLTAPGAETASSASGSEWASNVGMSAAYCKAAYRVATSRHSWVISTALWDVPADERAGRGWVRLSRELVVRQGRGTSLVCERRAMREVA